MEFFDDQMLDFMLFGIVANVVMLIITFVVTLLKTFTLNDSDLQQFAQFGRTRQYLILKHNSSLKIYAAFLLNMVPLYSAVLNTWFLLHILLVPGLRGLIMGTMRSDNLALIQLVKYEIVKVDK
jgi:hypothetical protein